MNKYVLIALFAAVAFSFSRPPSDEPFVRRENAEYGDTYEFLLDMADSTITYGLDFYTRLERKSFGTFPEDSLVLALRWIAPSDSNYVDTLVVSLRQADGNAYYTKDIIYPFKERLAIPEHGQWRLKARVLNDAESVRGLGVIFKRNQWATTN